jgi:uncharacterized protein
VILVDTGPIVAAALTGDMHHRACVDLFTSAHLARQPHSRRRVNSAV